MTPEQFEQFSQVLAQLGDFRGEMSPKAQQFFDDQVKRFDLYGERTFLSPKQQSWLESLYTQHVGPMEDLEGVRQSPSEDEKAEAGASHSQPGDLDDDIPF